MKAHEILNKYVERKKKQSKNFSLRWLAQRLRISAPFLSRVLNGKKPLPSSLIPTLASVLEIEPEMVAALQTLSQPVPEKRRQDRKVDTSLNEWELAESSTQLLLSEWYYLAILDFTTLRDFDGTNHMIRQRLGLDEQTVQSAIQKLLKLGLLEEKDGKPIKIRRRLRWGSSKSLDFIRKFHISMLSKAIEQLKTQNSQEDFERRLITGITLTAPKDKIDGARRKLADCLHEIANDLTEESGNEVYHLSAQLFPLTKKS